MNKRGVDFTKQSSQLQFSVDGKTHKSYPDYIWHLSICKKDVELTGKNKVDFTINNRYRFDNWSEES